jgi:hypothetical protein
MVTACDRYIGVVRNAELDEAPNIQCVEETLNAATEVGDIRKTVYDHAGRQLTWFGLAPHDRIITYYYNSSENPNIVASLNFTFSGVGKYRVANTNLRLIGYGKYSQEDIDKTRILMDIVEGRLASECNLTAFENSRTESCSRYLECPSISEHVQ